MSGKSQTIRYLTFCWLSQILLTYQRAPKVCPRFSRDDVYSDIGIFAFWASPFPKTLVIWASPSHITLAFWIRVRVTGNAYITRVLGMRMPKMWGCPYHRINAVFMYHRGTEVQQLRRLVMSRIHCRRPWQNKFEQISDHCRNLGCVGKI